MSVVTAPYVETGAQADPLLGGWRLAGLTTTQGAAVDLPLGPRPFGHLSYDRDGRMAVQLCRGPDAEGNTAMPAFTAYCGRYTVDRTAGMVVHHIEAGSLPQLAGTDQARRFQRDGDHLRLSADTARGETVLEWVRARHGAGAAPAPDTDDAPWPGFSPLRTLGIFPARCGRYYVKDRDGGSPIVGTRIGPGQSNSEGFAHGGFLVAFADFALTMIVSGVTLNLSADFIRPARIGDWIEAGIVTRKRTAALIFADAIATCKGRDLLRISGVFKPLRTTP